MEGKLLFKKTSIHDITWLSDRQWQHGRIYAKICEDYWIITIDFRIEIISFNLFVCVYAKLRWVFIYNICV